MASKWSKTVPKHIFMAFWTPSAYNFGRFHAVFWGSWGHFGVQRAQKGPKRAKRGSKWPTMGQNGQKVEFWLYFVIFDTLALFGPMVPLFWPFWTHFHHILVFFTTFDSNPRAISAVLWNKTAGNGPAPQVCRSPHGPTPLRWNQSRLRHLPKETTQMV